MEYNLLKQAREIAPFVGQANITVDTCPAFMIQYCGLLGASAVSTTTCTIAFVQGGDMTVLVDSAAPAGVDAIGTSGVIDTTAVAYDTVGELCAYIDALGPYRAICLCDPDTLMANVLAKSAASCIGSSGLVFYLDTSVADTTYIWSFPITGEAFLNNGKTGHVRDLPVSDGGDEVENSFHFMQITTASSATATVYIKSFKQGDSTATTLYTKAISAATATDIGNASNPTMPFLTAKPGNTMVVEIRQAVNANAPSVMQLTGRSVVTTGTRIVNKAPHLSA